MKTKVIRICLISVAIIFAVFIGIILLYIASETRYNTKMSMRQPILQIQDYYLRLLEFKCDESKKNEIEGLLINSSFQSYFKEELKKNDFCVYVRITETERFSYEMVLIVKYYNDRIASFYCFLIDYKHRQLYFINTVTPDGKAISINAETSIWNLPNREKIFIDKMNELIKDNKVETLYYQHLISRFK